jgi:phospholipid transport system substrate-binding protein
MVWCRGIAFIVVVLFALPVAAAAVDSDASGFVEHYIAATRRIRGDASLPPAQKLAQTQALLHEAYDFNGAPQAILGRHWAKASADQQRRYLEQFEQYLIVAYGKRFDDVAASLAVSGATAEGKRTIVHSASGGEGARTQIDWVLVQPEGTRWRIADVIVNGVSSVETMRQEFSAVLRANNDDMEALLTALHQRTEAVRAGG